jgi:cytochrome c-type biogenesis protein CcmH
MELRLIVMALICLCIAQLAFAAEDNYPFRSPDEQRRFVDLIKEVRCSTCKNQTLYDSNASVALDMRKQIYQMLTAGASDASIKSYLTAKYGEYILFSPPWRLGTLLLWLSPLFMLTVAMLFVTRLFKYTRYPV